MRAIDATAEIFFTAFKTLKSRQKHAFLEKILSDPKLKEDIVDIAFIEQAKKVKGVPASARDYFARRRKAESAS
jgi:uncharacterized protein YbaA (DUF1428 family)